MDREQAESRRRRSRPLAIGLTVAAVLVIAGAGIVTGLRAADDVGIPVGSDVGSEILQEARDFWDNPFERMGILSMAITDEWGRSICPNYFVTAYTLFGIPASRLEINCHGTVTRLDQ